MNMRFALRLAAVLPLLAVALLPTPVRAASADVTRFHLGQPIARDKIAVVALPPAVGGTPEFKSYADAVAGALRAEGFTPVETSAEAGVIASLGITQTYREQEGGGPAITFGIGGGTSMGGVGVGVGVTVGGNRPRRPAAAGGAGPGVPRGGGADTALPEIRQPARGDMAITTLVLRMKRLADNSVIWEGRAVLEAKVGSKAGSTANAVPMLANALLKGFPGPSGQTVRIRL